MAILLLAEHDNATVSDLTARALTAAAQIGGDIDILVAGKGAQGQELEVGAPDSATLQRLRDKLGMPAKKERADDAH